MGPDFFPDRAEGDRVGGGSRSNQIIRSPSFHQIGGIDTPARTPAGFAFGSPFLNPDLFFPSREILPTVFPRAVVVVNDISVKSGTNSVRESQTGSHIGFGSQDERPVSRTWEVVRSVVLRVGREWLI